MNIVHDVKVSIEINCHARLAEIDCKAVAYFYEPNKTYYVGLLNQLEKRGNPPGFAGLVWFQPKYKVINSISFIYCILIFFYVKVLLFIVFVFSYFNLFYAKPLLSKTPFLRAQAYSQHFQGQDSQPLSNATEPEKNINQESKITSDGFGVMERPTAHDRIVRNTHPCVSRVAREFDSCRNLWVNKVQCKRSHPACSSVVGTHGIPKCQPVYGFRNASFVTKCSSLPIDCQCAS